MSTKLSHVGPSCVAFICIAMFAATLLGQQTRVVPPSNDLANKIGCNVSWNGQGFVVGQVFRGPARQAGLETGDIIVSVGQNRLRNSASLRTALENSQGSRRVQLTVINVRDGQYCRVWMPCPVIGPPIVIDPPPQQQKIYSVTLRHPVTGGVVFSSTVTGSTRLARKKAEYGRYHWRIWKYNGIEEDLRYRRFSSAQAAHNYYLNGSLLGFYINKVQPGRVSFQRINE